MKTNDLTREIIGGAIEVHRELGPAKPEAAYERALAVELTRRGLQLVTQHAVPVVYKGVKLDCGYRLDLLAAHTVVIEVKAVEAVHPVHRAQVLTYLKLGGWKIALLLNFNVAVLKEGIQRLVLGLDEHGDETAVTRSTQRGEASSAALPHRFRSADDSGDADAERAAHEVVDAAMEVHQALGPGLLASAYQACLCHELHLRAVPFERKQSLPLVYKGTPLGESDEVELVVRKKVIVNPCALAALQPVHEAALLSQLRLGRWRLGLLINFNTIHLADGLRRLVLSRAD